MLNSLLAQLQSLVWADMYVIENVSAVILSVTHGRGLQIGVSEETVKRKIRVLVLLFASSVLGYTEPTAGCKKNFSNASRAFLYILGILGLRAPTLASVSD